MDSHQNARLRIHRREQPARKVLGEGCTPAADKQQRERRDRS